MTDPEQLGDASQLLAHELPFKQEDWDKLTPEMLRNTTQALIAVSGLPLLTAINGVTLPGATVTASNLTISAGPRAQS